MSNQQIVKLEEMLNKIELQIASLRESDKERLIQLVKEKIKITEELNRLQKHIHESLQREQQDWDDR